MKNIKERRFSNWNFPPEWLNYCVAISIIKDFYTALFLIKGSSQMDSGCWKVMECGTLYSI